MLERRKQNAARISEAEVRRLRIKIHGKCADLGLRRDAPFPEDMKEIVKAAHAYMISVCDGAYMRDGQGFNKPDASVMHWMASTEYQDDASYWLALAILRRYRRQLYPRFPQLWRDDI